MDYPGEIVPVVAHLGNQLVSAVTNEEVPVHEPPLFSLLGDYSRVLRPSRVEAVLRVLQVPHQGKTLRPLRAQPLELFLGVLGRFEAVDNFGDAVHSWLTQFGNEMFYF